VPAEDFAGRRVLVTGHTGAVGTWLTRWLAMLGADVMGFSRGRREPPVPPPPGVRAMAGDVTDRAALSRLLAGHRTEIVFHLAGQAVVADGFAAPLRTFTDNVLGTAAVLEAALHEPAVRAVVVVGTPADGAVRDDLALPPYAGSKGAAEAVAAGYGHPQTQRAAGRDVPLSIGVARPGVLIGGDWTPGRLLTDVVAAVRAGRPVAVHRGGSIRPWQHVLDGVHGILTLGRALLVAPPARRRYDFGCPPPHDAVTAMEVVTAFLAAYGCPQWTVEVGEQRAPDRVTLAGDAARAELGWWPVWPLDRTVEAAARWYHAYGQPAALGAVTGALIQEYAEDTRVQLDRVRG
jgi:CDP-glucose 4,6-dehydratase